MHVTPARQNRRHRHVGSVRTQWDNHRNNPHAPPSPHPHPYPETYQLLADSGMVHVVPSRTWKVLGCKSIALSLLRTNFCDRCSSHRVPLDPSEVVQDPTAPDSSASTSSQRVCQSCYDIVSVPAPSRFRDWAASVERIFVDNARLSVPNPLRETSSQLSDLVEYALLPSKNG